MNNIDENTYVFGADQNEEASETFDFTQINGLGEENYENPDLFDIQEETPEPVIEQHIQDEPYFVEQPITSLADDEEFIPFSI